MYNDDNGTHTIMARDNMVWFRCGITHTTHTHNTHTHTHRLSTATECSPYSLVNSFDLSNTYPMIHPMSENPFSTRCFRTPLYTL